MNKIERLRMYRDSIGGGALRPPVVSDQRRAALEAQARKLDADHRRKQGKATRQDNLDRLRAAENGAPTMRDNAERLRAADSRVAYRPAPQRSASSSMIERRAADWWRSEIARMERETGLRADVIATWNDPRGMLVRAANAKLQALGA